MLRVLFFIAAALFCGAAASSAPPPADAVGSHTVTVRLGVMSFKGLNGFTTHIADEDRLLMKVPQWLSAHVPRIRLETRYYRMNDLIRAIQAKEVDIFLASSGLFW
ncbi:MAG: hypothetical protein EGQ76_00095, partial [Sutterella sp.]|nr:hypothetical protein [Sutterella sp.]